MNFQLPKDRVFVIAEIGPNHNGLVSVAKQLIDAVLDAGCDAVKFQKKTPHLALAPELWHIERDTPWGSRMTYLEYRKQIEFGEEEYWEITHYCKAKGVVWFASPWDTASVDFLENFDVPFYKVASACLTDLKLLRKINATGKPVILSTGMSSVEQIKTAVSQLGFSDRGGLELALLACTSNYPAAIETLNLRRIETLISAFPDSPVGYSGHEAGLWTTLCAVAMGARIVERHITLDRAMPGSDQAASVEPQGFKKLVKEIRNFKKALGDGNLGLQECEKKDLERLRKFK